MLGGRSIVLDKQTAFFCLRSYWFASSFHVIGHGKIENFNSQSQHEEQGEGGIFFAKCRSFSFKFFFPHRTIFLFLFKAFFNKTCMVFNKVKLFAHFFSKIHSCGNRIDLDLQFLPCCWCITYP